MFQNGNSINLKIKKRNFIFEKRHKADINNEVKSGALINTKFDEIWREKIKKLYANTYLEEKYQLEQIIKRYKSNQDEKKGYDYKYIFKLTDLLGKKDKNYSQKRLELYNSRVKDKKIKLIIHNNDKYSLPSYNNTNNYYKKINNLFDKKKEYNIIKNNRNQRLYQTFYNINNNSINKKKYISLYNKPKYKSNSFYKIKSLKNAMINSNNKNIKNDYIENNNTNSSFLLTQCNQNKENSFDTTSLVGKEDFLVSRDKDKYHEYLHKKYNFYNQSKLNQINFILEKKRRAKLFKNIPNYKFLTYTKEDSFKRDYFNKIYRHKKNNKYFGNSNIIKRNLTRIENKSIKAKFYNECQNILKKVKKSITNLNYS